MNTNQNNDQNQPAAETNLVRRVLETSLAIGGLSDLMKATEVPMLLIDTSGSMSGNPIRLLQKAVTEIQSAGPVPMIAFGGPFDAQVRFVDIVPPADGGTPLHMAIPFAKEYGATRLVVISDGLPDLPAQSIEEAKNFGGRIDVVFVGHAHDGGATLLETLAKMTGGQRLQGNLAETKALAATVIGLLDGEVTPTRGPIQGPGFSASEPEPTDDEEKDDEEDTDDDDEDDEDEDEDDEDA